MKVGVVSFHDFDYGLDVANMLADAGHSVYLYTNFLRAGLSLSGDVTEKRISELGLVPESVQVRLFKFGRMRNPMNILTVRKIHKQMQKDGITLAHLLVAQGDIRSVFLSMSIHDIATVSTFIVPLPNVGDSVPVWVAKLVYGITAARSDMVIVNGKTQVDLVKKLYHVPEGHIAYVPLGMQAAHNWSRQIQAEEAGTILFFGRAAVHKGLEYLVYAQPMITKQVPAARIIVSSYGEDLERCKALIIDPEKFEIHEGFVPGERLPSYFQRASIVVLPYLTASTSGILMTALAFGKPVVVTNVGCLPEYVQDGITGIIVPPRDAERLAEAIIHLLKNDELRHKMGDAGYQWAIEQRTVISSLYEKYYQKAMNFHYK
jgi:glycosyltransferase involved in cell wall biosynthesis